MPAFQRKTALLAQIQDEHTLLVALLQTLSEQQMLRPGVAGAWSVKDVLVHLTWWEQDLIRKIATGASLDPELKKDEQAVDHANTVTVESRRRTPFTDVFAEFQSSYQQLLRALEGLTDEDLDNEDTYSYLVNNTSAHYAEHRVWIAASLQPRSGFSLTANRWS